MPEHHTTPQEDLQNAGGASVCLAVANAMHVDDEAAGVEDGRLDGNVGLADVLAGMDVDNARTGMKLLIGELLLPCSVSAAPALLFAIAPGRAWLP